MRNTKKFIKKKKHSSVMKYATISTIKETAEYELTVMKRDKRKAVYFFKSFLKWLYSCDMPDRPFYSRLYSRESTELKYQLISETRI